MKSIISGCILCFQFAVLLDSVQVAPKNEVEWSAHLAKTELNLDVETACEFPLPDGTRVDIYDKDSGIAWEVEWAKKADSAFGQSARYANALGCEPGVWLLIEPRNDEYFLRAILSLNELTENGKVIHFRWTDTRTGVTTIRGSSNE